MRASGYGLKVFVVFFMKGKHRLGEYRVLSGLDGVDWTVFGRGSLLGPEDIRAEDRELGSKALTAARRAVENGQYDLVVMDEINTAVAWKIVDLESVLKLIKDKPDNVELILTGRYAEPQLIAAADLVTEMVNIKHPYDKGIGARKGIDY
jgi:cob(I)alamin adenosyltransferase